MYLFMVISYNTLLPIDNRHAVAVDIRKAIKLIPVRLKSLELDVLAKITNVSNDFNSVVIVLYFFYLFFDLLFLSLKYVIISLMLLIELLKLLTTFNFFSNLCSRSVFSISGAAGYNLSYFCSIYIVSIRQIYQDNDPCQHDEN